MTIEAIYSMLDEPINRHNDIDSAWSHILLKNNEQIQKKIAFKNPKKFKIPARQDGISGTDDREKRGNFSGPVLSSCCRLFHYWKLKEDKSKKENSIACIRIYTCMFLLSKFNSLYNI